MWNASIRAESQYVESFHERLRKDCLQVSWFQNLFDARRKMTASRPAYNQQRPLSSPNYLTPVEFAGQTSYARAENTQDVSHCHPAMAAAG